MKITLQDLNQAALLVLARDLSNEPEEVSFYRSNHDKVGQLAYVIQKERDRKNFSMDRATAIVGNLDAQEIREIAMISKSLQILGIDPDLYENRPLDKLVLLLHGVPANQYQSILKEEFFDVNKRPRQVMEKIAAERAWLIPLLASLAIPSCQGSADLLESVKKFAADEAQQVIQSENGGVGVADENENILRRPEYDDKGNSPKDRQK